MYIIGVWQILATVLVSAVIIAVVLGLVIVLARSGNTSFTRNTQGWGYKRHDSHRQRHRNQENGKHTTCCHY